MRRWIETGIRRSTIDSSIDKGTSQTARKPLSCDCIVCSWIEPSVRCADPLWLLSEKPAGSFFSLLASSPPCHRVAFHFTLRPRVLCWFALYDKYRTGNQRRFRVDGYRFPAHRNTRVDVSFFLRRSTLGNRKVLSSPFRSSSCLATMFIFLLVLQCFFEVKFSSISDLCSFSATRT